MEIRYSWGGLAERFKAPISKIGWAQALGGSNPPPTAIRMMDGSLSEPSILSYVYSNTG